MENKTSSIVKPGILSENMFSISSYIKQSYNLAYKQVQGGVNFIKGEFSGLYDKTTDYINRMTLPVNNFLKDIADIEEDFRRELGIDGGIPPAPGIVPINIALASGPMEENY